MEAQMRDAAEQRFNQQTAELYDKQIPYHDRDRKRKRLVREQEDAIATPTDPEDAKDAEEYLERLMRITITE